MVLGRGRDKKSYSFCYKANMRAVYTSKTRAWLSNKRWSLRTTGLADRTVGSLWFDDRRMTKACLRETQPFPVLLPTDF